MIKFSNYFNIELICVCVCDENKKLKYSCIDVKFILISNMNYYFLLVLLLVHNPSKIIYSLALRRQLSQRKKLIN